MQKGLNGNILAVSNYSSDTGYAWWLMEHLWCLLGQIGERSGCRVYLAYPEVRMVSKVIENSTLQVVEMRLPWEDRRDRDRVARFIQDHGIGTVYLTDQPYFNTKYGQLRDWGVSKILVHDHAPGDRPAVRGIKGALKAMRNRASGYCADAVFCVSDLMRTRSIENGRVPPGKCHVVQNGITPIPATSEREQAEMRSKLGLTEETFVVVSTGRAHPYKRFDFISECAERLAKKCPDLSVVFLLVGDGPAFRELHDSVVSRKLDGTVKLLGFRSDVHAILGASDLAIHAALGEGFSLSIVEYMSAGLPVLVPDIPSVRQAIDDGVNGCVYSSHDHEAVAERVASLAGNRSVAKQMGEKAKHKADSLYSLQNCSDQFVRTVEGLLEIQEDRFEEPVSGVPMSAFKAQ